jgi:hypothetical protein
MAKSIGHDDDRRGAAEVGEGRFSSLLIIMNEIRSARWVFVGRSQAARARYTIRSVVRRTVASLVRTRSILAVILGAVLASWLGPIAVARYQRSVALRDDTARILDALIRTRAELEAAVDQYHESQRIYWQLQLDEQITAARVMAATTVASPEPQLLAQQEGQRQALNDATEDFRQARQLFIQRATSTTSPEGTTSSDCRYYFPIISGQYVARSKT